MSGVAEENLLETGSIPQEKISVEAAVAELGKAATLAEWIYAGLRIETRDWSAELRKSAEVTLPKFVLMENASDTTGSVGLHFADDAASATKAHGSSGGISNLNTSTLDQMLAGVLEARVMGLDSKITFYSAPAHAMTGHIQELVGSQIVPSTVVPASSVMPAIVPVSAEPEIVIVVAETPAPSVLGETAAPVVAESVLAPFEAPVEPVIADVVAAETPVVVAVSEESPSATVVVAEVLPAVEVATHVVLVEFPAIVEAVPVPVYTPAEIVAAETPEEFAPEILIVAEVVVTQEVASTVVPVEMPVNVEAVLAPVYPPVEIVVSEDVLAETPVVVAVTEESAPAIMIAEVIPADEIVTPVVPVEMPVNVEAVIVPVDVPAEVVVVEVVVVETPVVVAVTEESAPAIMIAEVIPADEIVMPVVPVEMPATVEVAVVAGTVAEVVAVEVVIAEVVVFETLTLDESTAEPAVNTSISGPAIIPEVANLVLGWDRLYFHDFDSSEAKIVIRSDVITSYEILMSKVDLYQDEASTVFELVTGADFIILTQFSIKDVTADMFVFEPAGDAPSSVSVVFNPSAAEEGTADIFNFGLDSGLVYINDFQPGLDTILINPDLFNTYAELLDQTAIYQDGTSTVFELHNGVDMIILPHFSIKDVNADMFVFEAAMPTAESAAFDIKQGTAGDDTLIFGAGSQMIDPGFGFDVVTGGAGSDTFVFNATSGHDFIVDFHAGEDHILIGSDLAHDFDALMQNASIYQDGSATQIEFNGGQLITLYNTSASGSSANWFTFA
jgi:hypothetical protein